MDSLAPLPRIMSKVSFKKPTLLMGAITVSTRVAEEELINCIKMLVGNKVDKENERVVSKKEGTDFAREYGCLFLECGAKTGANVEQCFEELVLKVAFISHVTQLYSTDETPSLLVEGSSGVKKNIFKEKQPESGAAGGYWCSW
ncbi:hypothetical protein SAY87_020770 [Trapa incisa]|uniref:Uncharacterized protein n=1 Tax=Trapa incisa TaxID=236973 RepID=A0AAN7JRY0_9MYRT|nr:hypothetical protein SAY87_020770 [Trapa incisa]